MKLLNYWNDLLLFVCHFLLLPEDMYQVSWLATVACLSSEVIFDHRSFSCVSGIVAKIVKYVV